MPIKVGGLFLSLSKQLSHASGLGRTWFKAEKIMVKFKLKLRRNLPNSFKRWKFTEYEHRRSIQKTTRLGNTIWTAFRKGDRVK